VCWSLTIIIAKEKEVQGIDNPFPAKSRNKLCTF
jgi:hypothetical protein